MTALADVLGSFGIFLIGIVIRLLVFAAVLAAIALPVLAGMALASRVSALRRRLLGVGEAGDVSYRAGLLYAPSHTWLMPKGERLRIGLDALAARLIPDATAVALPRLGDVVSRGATLAEVTTGHRRLAVRSPIDGRVRKVNSRLAGHPERTQRDPYVDGWLVEVEPTASGGLFLWGEKARIWLATEASRFERELEHGHGLAAADGGAPRLDLVKALPDADWAALAASVVGSEAGEDAAWTMLPSDASSAPTR
jgi:glycine cleavage system H protein